MNSSIQQMPLSQMCRRVAIARDDAGLNQQQLSEVLGFNDRQTLSAIESGKRKLSAEELLAVMQATGKDLDFFTDTFQLVGEGEFSFRAEHAEPALLDEFQRRSGRWIATYRRLGEMQGKSTSALGHRLNLHARSSFEEAQAAGESLVREWGLGDVPATRMVEAAERNLDLLVLYIDAPQGVSGAACQLTEINVVLINRSDNPGRRNFDFAHELFHVLTWDRMPPEQVDVTTPRGHKAKRVEKLANKFASALLMPEIQLERFWQAKDREEIHAWMQRTARHFLVSGEALKWRLIGLGLMSEADFTTINEDRLRNLYAEEPIAATPLFSRPFVERLHAALLRGDVSVRRAASLTELDLEGLEELFADYRLEAPFDL